MADSPKEAGAGKGWVQMRPDWCPHETTCQYRMSSQHVLCIGQLPVSESHGAGENTHRMCQRGAEDDGSWLHTFVLNKGDAWTFRRMLDGVFGFTFRDGTGSVDPSDTDELRALSDFLKEARINIDDPVLLDPHHASQWALVADVADELDERRKVPDLREEVEELVRELDALRSVTGVSGCDSSACDDCGLPYSDGGFDDLVVSDDVWRRISPTGDEAGLLCPTCLCRAASKAGVETTAVFRSGSFSVIADSVSQEKR